MAAANLHPQRWYDEGALYPASRSHDPDAFDAVRQRSDGFPQDHLDVEVVPAGAGVASARAGACRSTSTSARSRAAAPRSCGST